MFSNWSPFPVYPRSYEIALLTRPSCVNLKLTESRARGLSKNMQVSQQTGIYIFIRALHSFCPPSRISNGHPTATQVNSFFLSSCFIVLYFFLSFIVLYSITLLQLFQTLSIRVIPTKLIKHFIWITFSFSSKILILPGPCSIQRYSRATSIYFIVSQIDSSVDTTSLN